MTSIETIKDLLARATKGPWCVSGGDVFIDTREQVCCLRGSASGECCGNPDVIGDYDRIAESSPANAALIALAPELARRLIDAEVRIVEIREILKWEYADVFDLCDDIQAALTQPTDGEKL